MNWRGRPLVSHEVIVELIAATTTHSGLRVRAELDQGSYPLGVKVTDRELAAVPLRATTGTGSGTTPSSPPPHSHARNQACRAETPKQRPGGGQAGDPAAHDEDPRVDHLALQA